MRETSSAGVRLQPGDGVCEPAAGRTPLELRDQLTSALKEYVTNPVVTVIVVETKPSVAYVTGEVNHPGAVTITDDQLTVLQALAMAGGLKDFANAKNIKILRKTGKNGQPITFNYKDAIHGSAPVYLHPGDTVVVPD